jgi:hypothetical protein
MDAKGNHKEDVIYSFYYDLLQSAGDTWEWAKFTRNALRALRSNRKEQGEG